MAKLYNLVRVFTATTGTGTMTLGGAVAGFLTFAQGGVPDGAVVSYGIRDGNNSEVGIGTYTSAGTTLTRTTVSASTNLGAFINLSGGAEVYITARAQDIVEKTGDTMTGSLSINCASPGLTLNKTAAGQDAAVYGMLNGVMRWGMRAADANAETGGNNGSHFSLTRYSDAGAFIDTPFYVSRNDGLTHVNALTATGAVTAASHYAGTAVHTAGGYLMSAMQLYGDPNQTTLYVNGSNCYINYTISSGWFTVYVNGTEQMRLQFGGDLVVKNNGYKPGGGVWADSNSDIRAKNIKGEYKHGLADVAKLRPVIYTFKGNNTNEPPGYGRTEKEKAEIKEKGISEPPVTVPYPNSDHYQPAKDGTEFTGLIAQEVETIFPDMVKKRAGYIDGQPVPDLRSLDTTALIFALVNAVKELKARVEALEAV
jgi:Chaperone of endosialidase